MPLDYNDEIPRSMRKYLDYYGWHFNKPAFEYAASQMWKKDQNGKRVNVERVTKEEVDGILKEYGMTIENTGNWDYMYWAQQAKADLMPGAIDDKQHLAHYIKKMTDDPDVSTETTFRKWYITMVGNGAGVPFEEFM